jgi:hypothetical protein
VLRGSSEWPAALSCTANPISRRSGGVRRKGAMWQHVQDQLAKRIPEWKCKRAGARYSRNNERRVREAEY